MFVKEFSIGTMGAIEAIGTTRDLHGRRGLSPSVLNKLENRLTKGKTKRSGSFLVDVVEHWVGISRRGLFGVKIQGLCYLENKSRV